MKRKGIRGGRVPRRQSRDTHHFISDRCAQKDLRGGHGGRGGGIASGEDVKRIG